MSQNIPNIFWKAKHLLIKHIAEKVTLALRRVKGTKQRITAETLLDKSLRQNVINLDEGYLIFRTIRNSPAYFENKRKEIMAMVRQLGLPSLFFSLSAADTN